MNNEQIPSPKPSFYETNVIFIKALVVGFLILALLIPTAMISGLISERESTQQAATQEVSSKWGDRQTITGLVLTLPYYAYARDTANRLIRTVEYAHFLPNLLNIKGKIQPEKRYRGIFEVVVYKSDLQFSGNFKNLELAKLNIDPKDVLWEKAFVGLGISDLRGVKEQVKIKWNGSENLFNAGLETNQVIESGISANVPIRPDSVSQIFDFQFDLKLNGSYWLYFAPVGKESIVDLNSDWASPSFSGSFLPDERQVSEKGFTAHWKVLHLNRNFPQQWLGNAQNITGASFGVDLILPADSYQQTTRSVKYAIMFLALTFTVFFFMEVLNGKFVHPIQYILVGLALCIFYVLLLSLSEHLGFSVAYWLASGAVVSLITFYARYVLQNNLLTGVLSGVLLILYGFLFVILQLEDYSLLFGSIGLFLALALVMFFSRKIDWYKIGLERLNKQD